MVIINPGKPIISAFGGASDMADVEIKYEQRAVGFGESCEEMRG
jgi:hypothetical protein